MGFKERKAELSAALEKYANALWRAAKFVKIALIIGGAMVVAVALAFDIAKANEEISHWTITGIFGAVLVAIGSAFDAVREKDAAQALLLADKTIEELREKEQELNEREKEFNDMVADHGRFDHEVTRGLELYNSMDVMRGAIEQSLSLPNISTATMIQTCLKAACDSLLVAFDFNIKDTWTICVFIAQRDGESGKDMLRCIAHMRKIPCDISEARSWPEGVGVAGIAYSMNKEIIIPDMSSPEFGTMFDKSSNARDYDKARYISMAAVPITIGTKPRPWGVAVVTSDRENHFSAEPSYGVATAEPIRAIAAMTALGVKAAEIALVSVTKKTDLPDTSATAGGDRPAPIATK
ncbi:MAG: hypothetical protein HYX37_20620 [Rhizobiales bacterium]|nr:hypothetical protein [Hyphomicrobiales bacterium]